MNHVITLNTEMKNKSIFYTLVICVILFVIFFFSRPSNSNSGFSSTSIVESNHSSFDFLPTSTTNQIIEHEFYTLSYNEKAEQAEWVAYELKKNHLSRTKRKRPYFIYDTKVSTKSASYKNYKKSGYTKGHLCPAGDRKFSKKAFDETFLTSNISPQTMAFNGGIWQKLESKTRYWATKNQKIYVVTGGVLKPHLRTIGREKVAVPEYFYKILLDYTQPEIKAIAFLMKHEKSNRPLYDFVVSIDEIERLTGIDFFPGLPDAIENKLESSSDYKDWSFR